MIMRAIGRGLLFFGVLFVLVGCRENAPVVAASAPRELPHEHLEATVSWGSLCSTGAEVESVLTDEAMITIRTVRGNLFILWAPMWQVELAEKKCAEVKKRPRRVIGEPPR